MPWACDGIITIHRGLSNHGLGFRVHSGLGLRGRNMENHMHKNMEPEMGTGLIGLMYGL